MNRFPTLALPRSGKGLWNLFHVSANLAPLAYFVFHIKFILLANRYRLQCNTTRSLNFFHPNTNKCLTILFLSPL